MVGIGINENVTISSETKINDKGTLELILKQGSLSEEEKVLASLGGNDVDDKSTKLLLFNPKLTNDSTGVVKAPGQIMKEIQDFRKQLAEFLLCYMTTEEVESLFGSNIPKTLSKIEDDKAFVVALKKDTTVDAITTGMVTLFVKLCKENNIFDSKKTFRLKLWRQKKEKNFPKLPAGFSKWVEPMDVPTPKVKIEKFDEQPYDSTTKLCRVSKEPMEADTISPEVVETTNSVFNNLEEESKGFVFPDSLNS
jgi:hypothetical protein